MQTYLDRYSTIRRPPHIRTGDEIDCFPWGELFVFQVRLKVGRGSMRISERKYGNLDVADCNL